MRFLYTLLVSLAAPVVFLGLLWRGLIDRKYWVRAGERLGYSSALNDRTIWVHAVSVGEVRAAAVLVPRLLEQWPNVPIVMTTTTPTGEQQVRDLFGGAVHHRYLPLDLPGSVNRFLDRVQPRLGVVMETEIWPNLYLECGERGIPLLIASARLSVRSVGRYQRLRGLLQQVFAQNVTIAAQSGMDAARYRAIGANTERIHVTGNVKFDLMVPERILEEGRLLRQALGERFVWVAGSTRDQEEEVMLLDAFQQLHGKQPDLLLVLVPRHPQRFAEVRGLLEKRSVPYVTRSSKAAVTPDVAVLLVDTLGELLAFYAAGDIAFVGGTLVPVGGHNLLEPAALGLPVLTGPHVFNAPDIARLLLDAGAAIEVRSAGEIAAAVNALRDPGERQRRGSAGRQVIEDNRGAVGKVMQLVEAALKK